MGPGCRSERGARAEGGELHRFKEKVGRARDGERVRRTVRAAGLSERTESGKGGSGNGLGQGRVRKLLGPRGRNWAAGREVGRGFGLLGWAGVFLFYFYFFSLFLFQTTPKLI